MTGPSYRAALQDEADRHCAATDPSEAGDVLVSVTSTLGVCFICFLVQSIEGPLCVLGGAIAREEAMRQTNQQLLSSPKVPLNHLATDPNDLALKRTTTWSPGESGDARHRSVSFTSGISDAFNKSHCESSAINRIRKTPCNGYCRGGVRINSEKSAPTLKKLTAPAFHADEDACELNSKQPER